MSNRVGKEQERELELIAKRPSPSETTPFEFQKFWRWWPCGNCGLQCGQMNLCCTACGVINRQYNPKRFAQFRSGQNIAIARQAECEQGHPGTRAALREFPNRPHCSICGAKVTP